MRTGKPSLHPLPGSTAWNSKLFDWSARIGYLIPLHFSGCPLLAHGVGAKFTSNTDAEQAGRRTTHQVPPVLARKGGRASGLGRRCWPHHWVPARRELHEFLQANLQVGHRGAIAFEVKLINFFVLFLCSELPTSTRQNRERCTNFITQSGRTLEFRSPQLHFLRWVALTLCSGARTQSNFGVLPKIKINKLENLLCAHTENIKRK